MQTTVHFQRQALTDYKLKDMPINTINTEAYIGKGKGWHVLLIIDYF